MDIITSTERLSQRGPDSKFTGEVWVTAILSSPNGSRLGVYLVSFAPKARTHWHSHPGEQILYVISGHGRVGKDGEPGKNIKPGDTVIILPGEKHWHGAAPTSPMIHLAVTDSGPAEWEQPVSDSEYDQLFD